MAEAEGSLGLGSCLGPQRVAEAFEEGALAFARAVLRYFAILCLSRSYQLLVTLAHGL